MALIMKEQDQSIKTNVNKIQSMREELEKQKNEVSQNRFKTQQQTQRISVLGDELKDTKNTLKVSKKKC